ncbi:MAG: hypothetical protein IJO70_00290 [Lachnospiraceae bacterium]|nr:hypothetical protein [Lachnospiraceae bacterium]
MNNRDYVRGAYDEIHAPDALFGKVMDMKNKEVKKFDKRNVLKYAAAFAAFAVAFAGSNGICYAATGETWVEKAIVYINGEKQEVDVTVTQEGDAAVAEMSLTVDENDDVVVSMVDEAEVSTEDTVGSMSNTAELKAEDGKVLLVVYGQTVDITEDFADGEAGGQVEYDGEMVNYTVTGTADAYEISLESNE